MTTRVMILLGLAWVGVVAVRFLLSPQTAFVPEFGIGIAAGPNMKARWMFVRAVSSLVMLLYHFVVLGWVVPLTWGIYRAWQRH
jgi:hypothetical protein